MIETAAFATVGGVIQANIDFEKLIAAIGDAVVISDTDGTAHRSTWAISTGAIGDAADREPRLDGVRRDS